MKPFPRPIAFVLMLGLLLAACEPASSTPTTIVSPPPSATTPVTAPAPAPTLVATEGVTPKGGPSGDTPVIGYLPDYRSLNPDWGNYLSDLIYFSAEPRTDGGLDASRLSPATLQGMQAMKALYGTRLYISLGGYGRSDNFGPMVTDLQARQKFIDSLVAFAHDNALDGIDFDWEFPANPAELEGYLALMSAVKQAGLTVSVALYPYTDIDLKPYLIADRVYIMSYDRGAKHSTFEQAVKDLDFFLQGGLRQEKLFLGIPFYGRQMTSPYTASPYADIMQTYASAPGTDEVNGIYFNGIDTVQKKVCYVRQNGFGGVMVWELGQDTSDDTSLLRAASRAARGNCTP